MRTPQRIQRAKRGKYFQSFRCNGSSPTSIASLSFASLSTDALYIKVLKVIGKFNINLKVPRWAAFLSRCQLLRPERAPPWTRLSAAQQESRAGIFPWPILCPWPKRVNFTVIKTATWSCLSVVVCRARKRRSTTGPRAAPLTAETGMRYLHEITFLPQNLN